MSVRSGIRWLTGGVGRAAVSYAAYVGFTWCSYGRVRHLSKGADADPLLGRFIPIYDVVERHSVRVAAPAEITFSC